MGCRVHTFLLGILSSLIIVACGGNIKDVPEILDIDVTDKSDSFDLSSLFDENGKHSLVRLETNEDCVIGEVTNLIQKYEKIFIVDNLTKSIYVFNVEGGFEYKISNYGRARNEYIDMTDVYIGDRYIYILDIISSKIILCSHEGKFEKVIRISDVWGHNMFVYNDDIYLMNKWSDSSNGLFRLFVLDHEGNLKSSLLPFKKRDLNRYFSQETAYAISTEGVRICYPSDNVIYTICGENDCIAAMYVDFNKQALPLKYATYNLLDIIREGISDKYILGIDRLATSSRYLFLSYGYQSSKYTTIYDVKNKKCNNVKALHTKNYFNLSLNRYFLSDDYLISYINAQSFKMVYEHVLKESMNADDKYQSQVITLANKIKSEDNGILVIHQLKNMNDD